MRCGTAGARRSTASARGRSPGATLSRCVLSLLLLVFTFHAISLNPARRTYSQDPETHRITDVFSFYHLPSTAIQASPPARVEAAYLYFYATSAAPSCADLGDGSVAVPVRNWKDETDDERKVLGDRLKALMGDALTLVARVRVRVTSALSGAVRCARSLTPRTVRPGRL